MESGGLTEGEEEGIKADLAAGRDLRDQPLCYAADGHWATSHGTESTYHPVHFIMCQIA